MKIELYNKHPKYNEYFYTELEMPASRYAIHDALQKIRFFKGDTLEFNISECNEFPEINGKNVDRANLFDLNRFARSLENMEEYQLVTMRAVFIRRQNEGTYRDGIMMGELINLAYGLNSLPSVKCINNIHELGEFVIENEMNPLLEDLKAETLDLIDRNALGVSQVNTDNGIFIDGYYVATSGYEIRNEYKENHPKDSDYLTLEKVFALEISKAPDDEMSISGSVSRSKDNPSQSLQMIERPLMTPDELKNLPKGTFVVMKTAHHPMKVKLKLFFKWGITFGEPFESAERGNRRVHYANRQSLIRAVLEKYPPTVDDMPAPRDESRRRGDHKPPQQHHGEIRIENPLKRERRNSQRAEEQNA